MSSLMFVNKKEIDYSNWTNVTIGSICKIYTGKSKKNYETGKYIIMDMGSVDSEGRILNNKKSIKGSDLIEKGSLIMPKDDIGGGNIICKSAYIPENDRYILGDHVFKLTSTTCNTMFLKYRLNSTSTNRSLKRKVTGSAQLGINISSIKKEIISIPIDMVEQSKIGTFLNYVDELIDLQRDKISLIKITKNGYLQQMFPSKESDIPKIRFKGFTDTWEQREFYSLCDLFTDGDWIESKDQSSSGVRLIQTGNIGIAEYVDKPNNQKWISEETFNRLNCKEVHPGDILISRLPEPAGRACIMPYLGKKMITAVDCTIVRTKSNVSNKYLLQYLTTQPYFNEVNTALAGGTRQRISRSNLGRFKIPTPVTFEEQNTIGEYFEKLDNLITLHQRKYDLLVELKKGYMQRIFSRD